MTTDENNDNAVFAELTKGGSSITSGLKKVDISEKVNKNPELQAERDKLAAENRAKVAAANKVKKPFRNTKKEGDEAQYELFKGYKVMENYAPEFLGDTRYLDVEETSDSLMIRNCENIEISVKKGGIKHFIVDNCKRVELIFGKNLYGKNSTDVTVCNSANVKVEFPDEVSPVFVTCCQNVELFASHEKYTDAEIASFCSTDSLVSFDTADFVNKCTGIPPFMLAKYSQEKKEWYLGPNFTFI